MVWGGGGGVLPAPDHVFAPAFSIADLPQPTASPKPLPPPPKPASTSDDDSADEAPPGIPLPRALLRTGQRPRRDRGAGGGGRVLSGPEVPGSPWAGLGGGAPAVSSCGHWGLNRRPLNRAPYIMPPGHYPRLRGLGWVGLGLGSRQRRCPTASVTLPDWPPVVWSHSRPDC